MAVHTWPHDHMACFILWTFYTLPAAILKKAFEGLKRALKEY